MNSAELYDSLTAFEGGNDSGKGLCQLGQQEWGATVPDTKPQEPPGIANPTGQKEEALIFADHDPSMINRSVPYRAVVGLFPMMIENVTRLMSLL